MAFWRRTTAPSSTDKNYINTSYGGRNRCIPISSTGFVLPNCTGYVHGRWLEMIGSCNLSINNADTFYPRTSDGYQRGQTPRLGAVICWGQNPGETHGGHVAIVEEIASDGTITTSNSGYGSSVFWQETVRPPYKYPHTGRNYYFQGFIYLPGSVPPTPPTPPVIKQVKKFNFLLIARKKRLYNYYKKY